MSIREKPKLFIGSSAESTGLAEALRNQLGDSVEAKVWTEGIFQLSEHTMDSLIKAVREFDFAAFLFSPDDIVKIRNRNYEAVRDNIVFELGLFIGGLGLKRTYFVKPSDCKDLRIPSDLLGITAAAYNSAALKENPEESLRDAATKIKEAILVEWERPYSDQTYARFEEIKSRFKRCLVSEILLAENPDELPNKSVLENESLSTILNINWLAKIDIHSNLAKIDFVGVEKTLAEARGKGDSWGQKTMNVSLKELESRIDEWEENIRTYRPPANDQTYARNDQIYARFEEIKSRFKQCLVSEILLAENADELPNKSELESESVSTVVKINSLAKVRIKDELAKMRYSYVDVTLAGAQGKGDRWDQKRMDVSLKELESSIDEWEDNIRKYRPPND